ncbi:iron chaperone [Pedobacter deserti]|uniref:iron chaperone n=1 Tax=Pedobacter deserti TaxID=2817382 RepID=UPI0021096617|nr:DUF1801 domain-containing protein [Pedobacter sp. SYSU D00382]
MKPKDFETYLIGLDEPVQLRLRELREAILDAFPEVEESIRYNMPAFGLQGAHVYVAGYKKHIGMYPFYDKELDAEAMAYRGKNTKDALHFPHHKPLPLALILGLVERKFS